MKSDGKGIQKLDFVYTQIKNLVQWCFCACLASCLQFWENDAEYRPRLNLGFHLLSGLNL